MSQDKIRALLAANDYTLLGSLYEDITGLKAPGDVARAKPGQGHFYVDLTTRLFAVLWFAEQCRLLENLVCIEWGYCKRRDEAQLEDKVQLCAAVADVVASGTIGIPPFSIAVLLVRLGLSAFCGCDGQKTYKEQVDKLIATWAAKASGKAPGHENSYDRDWYRAYVWLGDRFFDRGQYSKAAVYFQEALRAGGERAASDSRLLNQAAWTLCEIGRPAEAVEYAEEAANLEPNDDAILDTLGIVYFGCRDFERSIQVLERSIVVGRASGPTWDWSDGAQENRFHLVRSYVSAERLADARRVLQDMNKVARGSTWTQQAEELIKEQTNIDL
jgi:tetratricopeptide (TPR) repeat protein